MPEMGLPKNDSITQRAPLKKEAPLPLGIPNVNRKPKIRPPERDLNSLFKKTDLKFSNTGFQGGPQRRSKHQLILVSWLAAFIDFLLLVAASCLFVVVFSLIMKSSLRSLFVGIHLQHNTYVFLVMVFTTISWFYLVLTRVFMGASIGEWACDLRLGQPQQRMQQFYVLKVIFRTTVVVCVGFVTLPVLSLLLGKDVSGALSGLKLISLK